jgi:hypothetical protein
MNIDKAIKKIEKYLEVKVEQQSHMTYGFTYNGKACSLMSDYNGDACSFHIRNSKDVPDSMTDYFPGYFLKNVTQFLHALKHPLAKYSVGALVVGRKNRRAVHRGYSGRTGVVIENKDWGGVDVLFYGDERITSVMHERDLVGVE